LSYLLAFLGFAVLVLLHEFGHFAAAKAVGMRVERFSLFFPPHAFKIKRGETEYAIGTIPLGGYVRITGMNPNEDIPEAVVARAYFKMPVWKRIFVIAAGPAMNILVAFVILFGLYLHFGIAHGTTRVDRIETGSVAAKILRPGDKLVAVDGVRGDAAALGKQVATHTCAGTPKKGCPATTPATLLVIRDGKPVTIKAVPRYDPAAGRARLGFSFAVDRTGSGPGSAASESVSRMWDISTGTVTAITKLVYDSKARGQVSGIVGSYEVTQKSVAFDWAQALYVLAIISLSLALVNLFPFLPLDGGHIFWALAEKVRGRPIPYAVLERASAVGFVLVIALFAIGLSNDIGRLRGEGFSITR
jgi:regulator of sigma E protease